MPTAIHHQIALDDPFHTSEQEALMRQSQRWLGAAVIGCFWALTGCGTWMHSDKQSVTIFTNPPETAVVIDDYLHLSTGHSHAQPQRQPPRPGEQGRLRTGLAQD